MNGFEILYRDADSIAINKPAGIMVHPSKLSVDPTSCMTVLRDQIGQWVYPVHRLDRATSGVLVFGLHSDAASVLASQFREKSVRKTYYAIVRGFLESEGRIDKPLKSRSGSSVGEARTGFFTLGKAELPFPTTRYSTSRFSFAKLIPETGRLHQLRRHLASHSHPIIGDTTYGTGEANRIFSDAMGVSRLFLHCKRVEFSHFSVEAAFPGEFKTVFEKLAWSPD
jgi:tRNA pseudouridine65 synthase